MVLRIYMNNRVSTVYIIAKIIKNVISLKSLVAGHFL